VSLLAPDETTRAFIDLYTRPTVQWIPPPLTPAALTSLRQDLDAAPEGVVVLQLPGRGDSPALRRAAARWGLPLPAPRAAAEEIPGWVTDAGLRIAHRYALPNGRRYVLLEAASVVGAR
jgi:hypothetical protein